MNNKLLKENATMILYITNFIEQINNQREEAMNDKDICCSNKIILIKFYNSLISHFEQCLEEVNK